VFFECVGFSYVVLDLVCSAILPSNWLTGPCPNDAYVEELVSTKTLLQDPLTYRHELFWFLSLYFQFLFHCLVVYLHHDHPVTTVLTHYSPMAWYSLFVLKVPINTNQPTSMCICSRHFSQLCLSLLDVQSKRRRISTLCMKSTVFWQV